MSYLPSVFPLPMNNSFTSYFFDTMVLFSAAIFCLFNAKTTSEVHIENAKLYEFNTIIVDLRLGRGGRNQLLTGFSITSKNM